MYDNIEDEFDGFMPCRNDPRDIYLLRGTRPEGIAIGHFDGYAFTETVVDIDGNRYTYRGLVARHPTGRVNWDSLRQGQFGVEPEAAA